jgi:hypothetical protein
MPGYPTRSSVSACRSPSKPAGKKGTLMMDKDRTIEEILDIELAMFLSVNSEQTSGCQDHPESFKLHRRVQFSVWSFDTLASYLEDLRRAEASGKNLMRQKYARMQGLIPQAHANPLIDAIVRIKTGWQEEMFRKYPALMRGARPLTDAEEDAAMTSFETYARGELETYSDRTLELLHADMVAKLARRINVSEEVYEFLAQESGYASLQEAERKLGKRRGTPRPA